AGGDRAPRLDALRWPGARPPGEARHRAHRPARAVRTRAARYHPRLAPCALPDITGEYPLWRHAAWACQIDQQTPPVLLRLRRALGHGGTGGAGPPAYDGMPPRGRTRRLEESQRATGALTETCGSGLHADERENLGESAPVGARHRARRRPRRLPHDPGCTPSFAAKTVPELIDYAKFNPR